MKQVSVVRFARRKIATTVLGTMVATVAVQGIANAGQQAREVSVSTLGGPNRFSGPMRGVEDLRAMATTNRTQISSALGQAGIGDISTQVMDVLTTGYISDTTVAPGTHFEWMALKRSGRPGVLRNVRWTGRQSFDAFQFSVEAAGYNYTFIVPKICGNFALLSRTASPVAAVAPPPAPEPPPPPRAPEPIPEPPPVAQAPPPPPAVVIVEEKPANHWVATGFIGSSFSANGDLPFLADTTDGGVTFGGQLAKFWGYGGLEIISDFAPTFKIQSLALADHPSVNANMLNLIVKGAWGSESQFQPYISGGLGWITMRTTTFTIIGENLPINNVALATVDNTQSKFGSDLGGGFFVFASKWGIRGDVRHYRASTFDAEKLNNGTFANDFTQALVSGLTFWRANLGLAYRW
jgi:hypothetical protein